VVAAVETVAGTVREVNPADERPLAVHDHQLLVMAVHRALVPIGRDAEPRTRDQGSHRRLDLAAAGPKQRHRRPRPCQQANIDTPRGRLSEKLGQDNAIISPGQLERGTEEPTGEPHRILSGADRGGDPRQRHRPIDHHLNSIAVPGRERVWRLERRRRVQRRLPADAPQATAVMRTHPALHRVTEHRINSAERIAQTRRAACTRQACASRRSIRHDVNSELSTRTGRLAAAHRADLAFRA